MFLKKIVHSKRLEIKNLQKQNLQKKKEKGVLYRQHNMRYLENLYNTGMLTRRDKAIVIGVRQLIEIEEGIINFCRNKIKQFYRNIKNKDFRFKIYNQRLFPSSIKALIFNKDNFTCQVCKTHKDNLSEKIHLEVDHIIAWKDGGKTTYSNGQTICSDCNKGKHHSKKYLKLVV